MTSPLSTQVAKYLTSQFYGLNYSLRQRMDILDVSDPDSWPCQAQAALSWEVHLYGLWPKVTSHFLLKALLSEALCLLTTGHQFEAESW